jgi:hypothetical protein
MDDRETYSQAMAEAQVLVVLRGGHRDGEQWPVDVSSLDSNLAFDWHQDLPPEVYAITSDLETMADGRTARVARPRNG